MINNVAISQEAYTALLETKLFLDILESVGVKDWEGYQVAVEIIEKMEEE